jgi:phosphonate transport system substrate-binding protein
LERTLTFATYLAPSIYPVYEYIAKYIGEQVGCPARLVVGGSFDQFASGEVDAGFICGLPYVRLADLNPSPIRVLAAPVLLGERYSAQPIYFSDVIVHRDSPFESFEDLRGRTWSFNDPDSHSGYGVTLYHLASIGETGGFFGRVIEAGFHQESIRLVREGRVDASAIDSQVLAVAMRDDPTLADDLRVIGSLGPSTIQPVVASSLLPESLRDGIRAALLAMHTDPCSRARLAEGLFSHFHPVTDATYDDIRRMLAAAEAAGLTTLR